MTDQANTQQTTDDQRYVDPADLICPGLRRTGPLRTARLLAGGVGPTRTGILPPGRDGTVSDPLHGPPSRTGRDRLVSGCGHEEAARGGAVGGDATCTGHRAARRASTAPHRASCSPTSTLGRVGASHPRPTCPAGERRWDHHGDAGRAGTGAGAGRRRRRSPRRALVLARRAGGYGAQRPADGLPAGAPGRDIHPLPAHRRVGRAPLRTWRAGPRVALPPATGDAAAGAGQPPEQAVKSSEVHGWILH